ncbi:MAG: AI-2E family transporter [Anaerolineales bacterium]
MAEPIRPEDIQSPPWRTGTRLVAGVLIVLFGILLLYLLRSLLAMFTLAFLIAYMLHPILNWVTERTKIPRGLSAFLILLIFLLVILGATTGLSLSLSERVVDLANYLTNIAEQLPTQIQNLSTFTLKIGPWTLDLGSESISPLLSNLASSLSPLITQAGTLLGSVALAAASAISSFLLILVIAFYLLKDFDRIRPALIRLAPPVYRNDVAFLLTETNRVWRAFLRGQVLLGVVIGVLSGGSMFIIGLDFPLIIGVISGLLELVPMFGPVISAVIAALVGLFQTGNPFGVTPLAYGLIIVAIFTVIQQVENTILVPRILGENLNLPPLAVFVAVLAGGTLGGFLGILLASPTLATLRLYLGYVYNKVADLEGKPSPVVEMRPASNRLERLRASTTSFLDRLRQGGDRGDEDE